MFPRLRTSPFRPPTSRAAVSLAEVLIAMGLLAIGLLGVAAVFPVGGYYVQSGDIADRGGAIAQAALEDAIIAGHLDPENWLTLHYDAIRGNTVPPQEYVTDGLREAVIQANIAAPYATREQYIASTYGSAYVIDPIGFAAALDETQTGQGNEYWRPATVGTIIHRFPATRSLNPGALTFTSPSWAPWIAGNRFWPVRRVTTLLTPQELVLSAPDMGRLQRARALFTANDDLALTLPDNGDEPARQRVDTWNNGTANFASKRQPLGDYSWIITVAPPSDAARNALPTQPDAYPVDVSAVVFHKRFVADGVDGAMEAERLVAAQVVSTTPGGGQMLLQALPARDSTGAVIPGSPFEDLRGGHFVMVVGPHPQSTSVDPRLVLRWCRVLNIEDTGTVNNPVGGAPVALDGENTVLVSLRGPDWPWQPSGNTNSISNDLRVAIVPGAVAVHTKTMRLGTDEGYEWAVD